MLLTILLLARSRKDDENFENSTKCWICDNDYIDGGVTVRNHCHIKNIEVLHLEIVISMLN